MQQNTLAAATLEALRKAVGSPSEELSKAFTQSNSPTTGLTYYDLEAPAKTLYPVLTPLRNEIPRISGKGGTQANWKAVTKINASRVGMGVKEGARGRVITTQMKEYLAAYRGLGLEDTVTFEAQYAGQNFEDVRVRATTGLLQSFMMGEEILILGGNGTRSLGVTPTPTTSTATTGGSIAAATYNVACIALTLEAYIASDLTNGVPVSGNQTMADGSSQFVITGTCGKSNTASQTTTGAASTISASVAAVRGAVAYAWYVGTAGNEKLEAITTINSVTLTSLAGTGQALSAHSATDYSANTDVFDGMLAFAFDPNGGGYFKAMPTGTAGAGTPLTSSGDGGITEIDVALKWFWDNYKLTPDEILIGSQESTSIKKLILSAPATAAQRFTFATSQNGIVGGSMAVSYLNPYSMGGAKEIPFKLHPNMPDGTILFRTKQLPYQSSDVPNVIQMLERQSYYSIEWALRTRKYEMGVYCDEVLQCYAPFSLGVITNIAKS